MQTSLLFRFSWSVLNRLPQRALVASSCLSMFGLFWVQLCIEWSLCIPKVWVPVNKQRLVEALHILRRWVCKLIWWTLLVDCFSTILVLWKATHVLWIRLWSRLWIWRSLLLYIILLIFVIVLSISVNLVVTSLSSVLLWTLSLWCSVSLEAKHFGCLALIANSWVLNRKRWWRLCVSLVFWNTDLSILI